MTIFGNVVNDALWMAHSFVCKYKVEQNPDPVNSEGQNPDVLNYGATSPLSIFDFTSLTEQSVEKNPEETSQNLGSLAQRDVQGGELSEAFLNAVIESFT